MFFLMLFSKLKPLVLGQWYKCSGSQLDRVQAGAKHYMIWNNLILNNDADAGWKKTYISCLLCVGMLRNTLYTCSNVSRVQLQAAGIACSEALTVCGNNIMHSDKKCTDNYCLVNVYCGACSRGVAAAHGRYADRRGDRRSDEHLVARSSNATARLVSHSGKFHLGTNVTFSDCCYSISLLHHYGSIWNRQFMRCRLLRLMILSLYL